MTFQVMTNDRVATLACRMFAGRDKLLALGHTVVELTFPVSKYGEPRVPFLMGDVGKNRFYPLYLPPTYSNKGDGPEFTEDEVQAAWAQLQEQLAVQ